MKKDHTSVRLKQIMNERNLRQVDILKLTKPISEQFGERLEKNDLSQYVSGKSEPGQRKLFVLGKALGVNPTWLLGLDVPKEFNFADTHQTALPRQAGEHISLSPIQEKILSNCQQLNETGQKKVLDFSDDLIDSEKYTDVGREPDSRIAAHGASETEEDIQPPTEEIIT